MITDLAVVNDSRASGFGPWSFGYLMREMANQSATGIAPDVFVRRWLAYWETDHVINGFTVRSRPGMAQLIADWPKLADGALDLERAPFRLLAIVNRLDLRNNFVLGVPRAGGGGAGEARFVFGSVDSQGQAQPFTVILEYAIHRATFEEVQLWARLWYELKDFNLGDAAYLTRLESITQQFAAAAADPAQPPNGSALAQIRTNENALGSVWELREFRIDGDNDGYLRQVAVKQTPNLTFQGTATLQDFIVANEADILARRHSIRVEFPPQTPFLAGSALMQNNFRWRLPSDAPPELEEARRLFSLHTCNACHAAETGTQFTHVSPRASDQPAPLSDFLTRPDGDLALRKDDLRQLVEGGRSYESQRLPLQFVH